MKKKIQIHKGTVTYYAYDSFIEEDNIQLQTFLRDNILNLIVLGVGGDSDELQFDAYEERDENDEEYAARIIREKDNKKRQIENLQKQLEKLKLEEANDIQK